MKPDFWLRAVRGRYCLRQSVRAWQPENQQNTWRISDTSLCTYSIRWWYAFLSSDLSSIYRYICKSCLLILRAIWQKLNWQNYALKDVLSHSKFNGNCMPLKTIVSLISILLNVLLPSIMLQSLQQIYATMGIHLYQLHHHWVTSWRTPQNLRPS